MNDWVLIAMGIMSGLFSLAGISLLQHNWYKKEKAKHSYWLKRLRYQNKTKSPPPAPSPSGAMDWMQTLRNIPPDTLHSLVDTLGGDQPTDEEGISDTIMQLVKENPELVQQFLGKMRDKGSASEGTPYEE